MEFDSKGPLPLYLRGTMLRKEMECSCSKSALALAVARNVRRATLSSAVGYIAEKTADDPPNLTFSSYRMELQIIFQLHYDNKQVHQVRNNALSTYTYPSWCLLVPSESSEIYPMRLETNSVRLPSGSEVNFSTFLREFFSTGTQLDTAIIHDPENLYSRQKELYLDHSCGGSVRSSTIDELVFRFTTQTKEGAQQKVHLKHSCESPVRPNINGEGHLIRSEDESRSSRTSIWLESTASAKRKRFGTADISHTKFKGSKIRKSD